jgi:hypothetical protein
MRMREANHLPKRLRDRLARALDAVPELSSRPEQALYADTGRRPRRWPALALATGTAALVTLAALTGTASTGSANPAVWTGRALSALQPARPIATPQEPVATPPPEAPGSTSDGAPGARGAAPATPGRRSPEPGQTQRPTFPPGLFPLPPTGFPRFTPPPPPSGNPFPTPSGASDFGRGGR